MIAVKALFGKLKSLPFADEIALTDALRKATPAHEICPICGAKGRCRLYGTYMRMMITIVGGVRKEVPIGIPRVLCRSCKHTHALLPDVLIPYGSYSLRFILYILKQYLERTEPVAALCERWAISASTLYSWVHLFLKQYNLWFRALEHIAHISQVAVEQICAIDSFPFEFWNRFRFAFLQGTTTLSSKDRAKGKAYFPPVT